MSNTNQEEFATHLLETTETEFAETNGLFYVTKDGLNNGLALRIDPLAMGSVQLAAHGPEFVVMRIEGDGSTSFVLCALVAQRAILGDAAAIETQGLFVLHLLHMGKGKLLSCGTGKTILSFITDKLGSWKIGASRSLLLAALGALIGGVRDVRFEAFACQCLEVFPAAVTTVGTQSVEAANGLLCLLNHWQKLIIAGLIDHIRGNDDVVALIRGNLTVIGGR